MISAAPCFVPACALRALVMACLFIAAGFFVPASAGAEDAGHNGKVFCPIIYAIPLEYAGTIEDVLVRPGDKVEKGQALARYRLKDESTLAIMDYLDMSRTIFNTELSIINTEKEVLDVREQHDTARRLSAAQMGSAEHLKRLQSTLTLLRKQKELLLQRLDADKKNLEVRKATVARKLGLPVEVGSIPGHGELQTPLSGEVMLVDAELRRGMLVNNLPAAVTVAQTNPMEVRTRVFEAEIPGLRVGGKAEVEVISLDGRKYEGTITHIDRSSDDMHVDRPSYYGVRVSIPNDDGKLRPGFKTVVIFAPAQDAS